MYRANTWPRFSPLTCALSQLSITIYSVTRATPYITRSTNHTHGLTISTCSSTATEASAA